MGGPVQRGKLNPDLLNAFGGGAAKPTPGNKEGDKEKGSSLRSPSSSPITSSKVAASSTEPVKLSRSDSGGELRSPSPSRSEVLGTVSPSEPPDPLAERPDSKK